MGGLGHIGATLVDTLLASPEGHVVTVLDPLVHDVDPAYLHRIVSSGRVRFVRGDVSDMRNTWFMARQHDVTAYVAALTMPNTARDPEEGMLVNQRGEAPRHGLAPAVDDEPDRRRRAPGRRRGQEGGRGRRRQRRVGKR